MTLKYLLDENVDFLYQVQIQRQQPDIVVFRVGTPGTPPKQTSDPDILCWCEEHSFVLLTHNRKSMPVHLADHLAQGRHIPGIFILNDDLSLGQQLEELILIALASELSDYQDCITYLPII